jgi:hypothetical protein
VYVYERIIPSHFRKDSTGEFKVKRKYIPVHEIVGLHNLPDGLRGHDILWDYDPGHKPLTPKEVQSLWRDYRRRKEIWDAEERTDAKKRLAAALAGLAEDKCELAVIAEYERREEWHRKDADENTQYVAALLAAEDRAWREQALAKVRKVGDEIRKSDAAAAKRTVREQLKRLGKPTRNAIRLNLELPR